jgi:hypothetical protein
MNMINQDNIVMAISFILVAAFVVFWLLKRVKLRRAKSWPTEVGRVESTAVVLKSGGGQAGAAAYFAELKYSYTVQGHTYSGGLSRRFILRGRADKWIRRYTTHQPLSIRYNPAKANDSVLFDREQLIENEPGRN